MIAASEEPWPDPPAGVSVVVTRGGSRGDHLDQAAGHATADILAFVDPFAELTPGWHARAVELLADPTIGAAGGPNLLPSGADVRQRAAWLLLRSRLGAGPFAFRFRLAPARDVLEMPISNVAVRRAAFIQVGGFQSPTPLGDDTRLCYKLRTLAELRVVYDPGLAVMAAPPALMRPYLDVVSSWGWQRGDLARRLPETSRRAPYLLPPAGLILALAVLIAATVSFAGRALVLAGVAAYLIAALWVLVGGGNLRAGLLAATGLPMTHVGYALGFLRGFAGRSLGERTPSTSRKARLRILVCNWRDLAHPWAGGAEGYMHEIARRWVLAGHDVGWISARHPGTARVEVIDGIRIHRVGGGLTVYLFAALAYLTRLRDRYDVIVDCENGVPFFTPLYSRKPVVLLVHHVHAEVFRSELPGYLRWLALWLEGWLMPRVYRRTPVVAVSASTRDELLRGGWDGNRVSIVSNGVELPGATGEKGPDAAPLLLYLGRLRRYKSVDVLLRALPAIIAQVPGTRLAIVGQGPERETLERLGWKLGLADTVRFHGYLARGERDGLLASASLLVCPSAFEGFGVTCLEANAFGTPVVAAASGGLRDAVVDGQTGVLVPYGDAERLSEAVVALLNDPEGRARMGSAGRAWAGQHGWDESASTFMGIIAAAGRVPAADGAAADKSAWREPSERLSRP